MTSSNHNAFQLHATMRSRGPWLQFISVMAAGLVVAGCSVSPVPISNDELASLAQTRLDDGVNAQQPVRGAIDLPEAMARAVLYNLDYRIRKSEELIASGQLSGANAAMLPGLTASLSRNLRDKAEASSSANATTGQQSLATSTSQDQAINTSNATLAWNVLDLGLSYVRAQQASDQLLATRERRRKELARLIEDVRVTYWRALAAESLLRELPKVEARAQAALDQSKTLVGVGNVSPLAALSYQKEILELQDRLQSLQLDLISSRAQLASLMNLPPGTSFTLVRPKNDDPGARIPDGKSMLMKAVEQRPEIREALYQERITSRESVAAILETLPGVNLYVNANTTSNSYTLNKEWLGWGAQASFNLMRVFTLAQRMDLADAREELSREKTKALLSSVAMQVGISRERYAQARRHWEIAKASRDVESELLKQLEASMLAARSSEQDYVREELASLLARARYDMAVADLQSSWAAIQTTMGHDPYPVVETGDFTDLKSAFRAKLAQNAGTGSGKSSPTEPVAMKTAELVAEPDAPHQD